MKINETFLKILKHDLDAGNTIFLAGEPGIGKTAIVKWLAQIHDSECFVVQVNQMADKADLTGARLLPTKDGTSFEQRFFAHHKVRGAVEYAKENPRSSVFLLLDEINRTTPDVTSGALSISTERELGDQKLPDNIKIIVTGNTKGNVVALDDASLSRFAIYQVEPDTQTLIDYLDSRENGNKPLNRWVRKALVRNPHFIFAKSTPDSFTVVSGDKDDEDDDMDTQLATFNDLMDSGEELLQLTTPRTIEAISNWLDSASEDFLRELFQIPVTLGSRDVTALHEAIEAHVGNTPFSVALIGIIADDFASNVSNSTQKATITVPRPDCWDELNAITTQNELDNYIENLNDRERSGCMLYAMYDKNDNSAIITSLAYQTEAFDKEHGKKFLSLISSGLLEVDNVNAALAVQDSEIVKNHIRPVSETIGY